MHSTLLVAFLGCAAVATAAAQSCNRPVPPSGGHALVLEPVVEVVYSDGYVTAGSMHLPDVAAPSCGWPLIVFVHPLGSSRAHDIGLQQRLAGQGYAVWSYDVRGQGAGLADPRNASHPAAGTTLWGMVERFDLAEQIQFVANRAAWQGIVDCTRVAVVGSSQGGVHAWNAAAFAGQILTLQGRGSTIFPRVACAVAKDYVAEPVLDWVREGGLFSNWFVNQITDDAVHPGFLLDPAFAQAAATAFRAQDAASLLAAWDGEGRRLDARLLQTTVPVLYSHAYHDLIDSPLPTLQVLQGMTAPSRALLGTIGHNTPDNVLERGFREQVMLRWLHRWLWNETNEVELEPPFALSMMPLDRMLREDPAYPWTRSFGGDPLELPANAQRLLLRDDGSMQETAPATPQADATIDHQVTDPAFTPSYWLAAAAHRQLAAMLQAVPLSEQVYAAAPLAEEQELVASPRVHLVVTPSAPEWMIAALLTVQPPGGDEVMLSSFGTARRTSTPTQQEIVEFALPPVAARMPAGSVVRLRLRNHWLREAPMDRQLEVAPMFTPFRLAVAHGDAVAGSWLDLPLRQPRPALVASRTQLDLQTMPPLPMFLRAGAARAGCFYFVSASASGQVPGAPYLNDVVPLDVDWATGIVTVSVQRPEFAGFFGRLDQDGEATARFDFSGYAPLDASLRGLRLTFAGFVWDDPAASTGAAANAVDVFLR